MGILCDLVVAPAGDGERIAASLSPARTFGGIDIKGIDPVKFGTLHSMVTGRPFKELFALYDPVAMAGDEGPWVFQIPTDLITRLAALDETESAALSRRWAATEEFVADRWAEGDVTTALGAISSLSRRAVESRQSVFLWMSV